MLKSMTGYGQVIKENDRLLVKAEVKTLNSKNLDTTIRLPKQFFDKELEARNYINSVLERGKINVNIEVQIREQVSTKSFNKPLISYYYKDLKSFVAELGNFSDADILEQVMKMPEVLASESEIDNAPNGDWEIVMEALIEATALCDKFRQDEGAVLQEKLSEYIENIRQRASLIMEQDLNRINGIRSKFFDRLKELSQRDDLKIDENRFEQELLYYLEKLDISEEKVRLDSHLNYFVQTMNQELSNGKKLGFISQEIGREINTIGSKVSDAQIQRIVVEMKDELEKIKEQCLNIL